MAMRDSVSVCASHALPTQRSLGENRHERWQPPKPKELTPAMARARRSAGKVSLDHRHA